MPAATRETPSDSQASPVPLRAETECPHSVREELGLGGLALFLRCCVCGDVLVISGNRAWRVGSVEGCSAAESPRA